MRRSHGNGVEGYFFLRKERKGKRKGRKGFWGWLGFEGNPDTPLPEKKVTLHNLINEWRLKAL